MFVYTSLLRFYFDLPLYILSPIVTANSCNVQCDANNKQKKKKKTDVYSLLSGDLYLIFMKRVSSVSAFST